VGQETKEKSNQNAELCLLRRGRMSGTGLGRRDSSRLEKFNWKGKLRGRVGSWSSGRRMRFGIGQGDWQHTGGR
jgi:hypothetical protein